MESKKEKLISAVRLWAVSHGMETITDNSDNEERADIAFKKLGKIYGFVTESERSEKELRSVIAKSVLKCDYIYVVTDDNARRRELLKNIPESCGILCYGDSFGLGCLYQVLKEAKKL